MRQQPRQIMRLCTWLLAMTVSLSAHAHAQTTVFINELHYDNVGTDTGEFIEIAGPVGTNLTGWSIAFYNGHVNRRRVYDTIALNGTIPDQQHGFGTLAFFKTRLQNGGPDGLALLDPSGEVVQFLSYEGRFQAASGPAAGMMSTDIGVSEPSSTPVGQSLQLKGTGQTYEDFTFSPRSDASPGHTNDGQTFDQPDTSPGPPVVSIMAIQGAAHTSPYENREVRTSGVVTVVTDSGFYLQDPVGDQNIATSDALFIYTGAAPGIQVGDAMEVHGQVSEYLPGWDIDNLTTTEIAFPAIIVQSSGHPLPPPVVIGRDRQPPTSVIEDDELQQFDAQTDGIDFYESLEGMRVTIPQFQAVSSTNRYGEIFGVANGGRHATGRNSIKGLTVSAHDMNPERLQIDNNLLDTFSPDVQVGDELGDVTGVMDYAYGNYEVLTLSQPQVFKQHQLSREITDFMGGHDQLTVATMNVENLDPGDGRRFDELATIIVGHLRSPDILGLQEIQDNSGRADDGTVDASHTYSKLINAIHTAGGPAYEFRDIAPENNRDGGQPGGNIRVGFLWNPVRVQGIDRGDAGPTQATTIQATPQGPQLTLSPGRIDPANAAFSHSRKPLAGEFLFQGKRLFVIVTHWVSKWGSSPLFGAFQPAIDTGLEQRVQQARVVRQFVEQLLEADANAKVIILGDFNDFQFSRPLSILTGSGLLNLTETLPETERWTYLFQGNAQALDHILVSPSLQAGARYDIVHVNAGFSEAKQASDHDPSVAQFTIRPASR